MRALHFFDQNKNPAKSKITMPDYRCAPFWTDQVPWVGVTKINLASIILQSKKIKKHLLDCFGNLSSLIKIKIQRSTWNIPWKCCVWSTMCTRHKPLCLEEAIWLWIYLPNFKSNQNWLLRIQKPSLKIKRARE